MSFDAFGMDLGLVSFTHIACWTMQSLLGKLGVLDTLELTTRAAQTGFTVWNTEV